MLKTILILLLIPFSTFCQNYNINPHGTLIVSMINNEGIVVGADSRICITETKDDNSPVYSYSDGHQKIFTYRGIFIQMAGRYLFDNYTFYGLLNKFILTNRKKLIVSSFYEEFTRFAKSILSPTAHLDLLHNQFLISGYIKSLPYIYYYSDSYSDSVIGTGYFTNHLDQNGTAFGDSIAKNYSIDKKMKFIIDGITKHEKAGGLMGCIGGPVSIAYMKPNGKTIERIQKNYLYTTAKEEHEASFNDKIKRVYRSINDSIIYKHSLQSYLEKNKE